MTPVFKTLERALLTVLIWVQTVCKGYQQMTKVGASRERVNMAKTCITNDFLNLEFAFKYVIWEFLIHDLTPETQLLDAIGYGTDLNLLCTRDQLHIIFDRTFL